jgi:hypothetical protein
MKLYNFIATKYKGKKMLTPMYFGAEPWNRLKILRKKGFTSYTKQDPLSRIKKLIKK